MYIFTYRVCGKSSLVRFSQREGKRNTERGGERCGGGDGDGGVNKKNMKAPSKLTFYWQNVLQISGIYVWVDASWFSLLNSRNDVSYKNLIFNKSFWKFRQIISDIITSVLFGVGGRGRGGMEVGIWFA